MRETQKIDYGDTAGKTFGDAAHQMEFLRTGQPEQAILFLAVGDDFQVTEQFGRVLHLVYHDRRLVGLDEQPRVVASEGARIKVVKRDMAPAGLGAHLKQRGLPNLPRTGYQQDGKTATRTPDRALKRSSVFRAHGEFLV